MNFSIRRTFIICDKKILKFKDLNSNELSIIDDFKKEVIKEFTSEDSQEFGFINNSILSYYKGKSESKNFNDLSEKTMECLNLVVSLLE